jgi:hypothetical protein
MEKNWVGKGYTYGYFIWLSKQGSCAGSNLYGYQSKGVAGWGKVGRCNVLKTKGQSVRQ